ncbi:MmcB family DNA repair protein [Paenibacillus sp. P22]|uniref:MmcB family DNA repair protein n=1 Tax=Paenibacillus sp. P22 TaxID=483908 RepID=UPI0003903E36|nr:MmcB family DNA repair protein [Paenibacillus sp. P22]CDN44020.1 hypothetical protein BN871_EA_00150 [Paenibacillus sp. P22]
MTVRADQIKLALAEKHKEDFFLTEVKTGATWGSKDLLKFDAYAVKRSWAKPCLSGYEVKVSRNDFKQDDKWHAYMDYCHRFSFVCPSGLIDKTELPEEVGLIWYEASTKALHTKRRPLHRLIDIPADLMYYVLQSRIDPERHPFFNSEREFFEAYVADSYTRKKLGRDSGSKMYQEIRELRMKVERAAWEIEAARDARNLLGEIRQALIYYGINISLPEWKEELDMALVGAANPKLKHLVEEMAHSLLQMRALIGVVSNP